MISDKQKLENQIQNDIKSGKGIMAVAGAFGDVENCEGFIEKEMKPEEGGTLTKFYGCSYYFKGYPKQEIVEGIGLGKAMISEIPRNILGKSIILQIAAVFLYVFSRKRFYHYFHIYTTSIYFHIVYKTSLLFKSTFSGNEYNSVPREIKRATEVAIRILEKKKGIKTDFPLLNTDSAIADGNIQRIKREFFEAIAKLIAFICLFLEHDNAYRFPFQDVFSELNKENLKKSLLKELNRLANIFISREPKTGPIYKLVAMKSIIFGFLLINKDSREFVKEFLLELNIDQIKMDDNDWYFCLNRTGYNFKGLSYEERVKIRRQIDLEKGHLKVQMVELHFNSQPNKQVQKGLKVSYFDE